RLPPRPVFPTTGERGRRPRRRPPARRRGVPPRDAAAAGPPAQQRQSAPLPWSVRRRVTRAVGARPVAGAADRPGGSPQLPVGQPRRRPPARRRGVPPRDAAAAGPPAQQRQSAPLPWSVRRRVTRAVGARPVAGAADRPGGSPQLPVGQKGGVADPPRQGPGCPSARDPRVHQRCPRRRRGGAASPRRPRPGTAAAVGRRPPPPARGARGGTPAARLRPPPRSLFRYVRGSVLAPIFPQRSGCRGR
ncbi:hypothetical protein BU14_2957s0001, partial [Porphyra umbilicalis]